MRRPLDWEEVERLLASVPETEVVLVGGQAVNFWSRLYLERSVASVDLDLLGSAEDAEAWASALNVECHIPSLSDPTPNSALLQVEMGERLVTLDFLANVEGLNAAEIRNSAIRFDLSGHNLWVLHPLLCLESRIHNFRFPAKRDPHSLEQIRTAIDFVHAFIDERLVEGKIREALRCIERVFRLAETQYGKLVWYLHGIDVLEAIPKSQALGKSFWQKRHPQATTKIDSARRKFRRILERRRSKDEKDDEPGLGP